MSFSVSPQGKKDIFIRFQILTYFYVAFVKQVEIVALNFKVLVKLNKQQKLLQNSIA